MDKLNLLCAFLLKLAPTVSSKFPTHFIEKPIPHRTPGLSQSSHLLMTLIIEPAEIRNFFKASS